MQSTFKLCYSSKKDKKAKQALEFFQFSFLPFVITRAGSFLHLNSIVLNMSLLASGIGEIVILYVAARIFQNFGPTT